MIGRNDRIPENVTARLISLEVTDDEVRMIGTTAGEERREIGVTIDSDTFDDGMYEYFDQNYGALEALDAVLDDIAHGLCDEREG